MSMTKINDKKSMAKNNYKKQRQKSISKINIKNQ
jgi:hypothetical protein